MARVKRNRPKVTDHQLIKLISAHSKYHEYEVRDILRAMVYITQSELVKGNTVQIRGLGTWATFLIPERSWYNAHLDLHMTKPEEYRIGYRCDADIKGAVKKDSFLREDIESKGSK
jgi:nucleoid DNA-binding protein